MNIWKITTIVSTTGFILALGASAARPAAADPQPVMQSALASLETAKKQLESAKPDKGGHRVKALAAANEAIDQTKKGIEFDNKN